MVLNAAAGGEVVGTDNAVVGEDNAACCHAEVRSMISYRTAHTPNQTTYIQTEDNKREFEAQTVHKQHRWQTHKQQSTFGDGGTVGIGDEAGETDVYRAAEASVYRCSRCEAGNTLTVVKLPTHRNHTAPHILTALLTHKAGMDT